MRFLCVSDFQPDPNTGAAGSIVAIGDGLREAGHSVEYVWHEPGGRAPLGDRVAQLVALPLRQLAQVRARLSRAPYDVVIVSQPFAYLIYERLARRHPETLFLNRTHGWEERLYRARERFGFEVPGSRLRRLASRASRLATERASARTVRACDGVIAPSSLCADFVREHYGAAPEKVAVISYGLGRDVVGVGAAAPARGGARRLLYVGNYLARKGTGVLERQLPAVARRHPDAALTVVVREHDVARVREIYRPAFGERLVVHPWLDRRDLARVYAEHDVLLHPSYFEGFGKTWLEAMACGMCVVGFREGGLVDLASSERDALLVAPGDEDGFRRLLERALASPELVDAIRRRARETAERYSWSRTADATLEFCARRRTERRAARGAAR